MDKLKAFANTTGGRWLIKALITSFGALVSAGEIPLDMPVMFGLSLGQILMLLGILTPTGQMNPSFDKLRS